VRIAIPSTGERLTSLISETLGRAPFIIIYDNNTGEYESCENPGFKVQDGSGLKATDIILQNDVSVLLTREVGRKAYSILQKEHVKISLLDSSSTVKFAINKFLKKLEV